MPANSTNKTRATRTHAAAAPPALSVAESIPALTFTDDERAFYGTVRQLPSVGISPSARVLIDCGESLGVPEPRVRELVDVWTRLGWWRGGMAGWVTPSAPERI